MPLHHINTSKEVKATDRAVKARITAATSKKHANELPQLKAPAAPEAGQPVSRHQNQLAGPSTQPVSFASTACRQLWMSSRRHLRRRDGRRQ